MVWSPSGASGTLAENPAAGSHTATVTDALGCIGIQTATVSEPPGPGVGVAASPATCGFADGSAAASRKGTPPFTYRWSPMGGTSDLAMGLSAGTYSVTVTDSYRCFQTASVEVGVSVADSFVAGNAAGNTGNLRGQRRYRPGAGNRRVGALYV